MEKEEKIKYAESENRSEEERWKRGRDEAETREIETKRPKEETGEALKEDEVWKLRNDERMRKK